MKSIDELYGTQKSDNDVFAGLNKKGDFSNTKKVVESIKKFGNIIKRMKPKSITHDENILSQIKNASKEELQETLDDIEKRIVELEQDKSIIQAVLKTKR